MTTFASPQTPSQITDTQVPALTQVATTAFADHPLVAWLLPDAPERNNALRAYLRLTISHASLGHADPELRSVALWTLHRRPRAPVTDLPVDAADEPASAHATLLAAIADAYTAALTAAVGPWAERFQALGQATTAAHRDSRRTLGERFEHLDLLAVDPALRRTGLATALLNHRHFALDRTGTPACTEAVGDGALSLLQSCGYTPYGKPLDLPHGGPLLQPMWRAPQPLQRSPTIGEPA